jgi:hypothetical protein
MSQLNTDVTVRNQDEEAQVFNPEEGRVRDYDDQPYGDDNVLVRASKRRAFLYTASQL